MDGSEYRPNFYFVEIEKNWDRMTPTEKSPRGQKYLEQMPKTD